jgi:hypothetical protein
MPSSRIVILTAHQLIKFLNILPFADKKNPGVNKESTHPGFHFDADADPASQNYVEFLKKTWISGWLRWRRF